MTDYVRNAGKYRHRISIVEIIQGEDNDGFPTLTETVLLEPYAHIRTTKGYTLIKNDSDFEKAYTNFTIRYSQTLVDRYNEIDRNLRIKFRGKEYVIEYLNNIDELNFEIELQAKVVQK